MVGGGIVTALDETKVTCFYSASLAEPIDGVTLSVGNGQGQHGMGGDCQGSSNRELIWVGP